MKALILHKSSDKLAIVATIPVKELINKIKFTQREFSTWSDKDNKVDEQFDKFYQRPINASRLKSIKKYISDSLFNDSGQNNLLFPTSILMAVDLDMEEITRSDDNYIDLDIFNPNLEEKILIVDGQHRMKAIQELYKEVSNSIFDDRLKILEDTKLNCTLLINYSIWDQAKIFADVNFKQKPVDRSLYYDIFGEYYDDENKSNNTLYIAHQLGKFLNKGDRSPLKGFVKDFHKQTGFVSQAFITTSLMNLLGVRGFWNYISKDFKSNKDEYLTKVPNVLVAYFNVIKDIFSDYWPKDLNPKNSTLLTKTTALGAFFKLLGLIDDRLRRGLIKVKENEMLEINLIDLPEEKIEKIIRQVFKPFDKNTPQGKELIEQYFGENSKYKSGGGEGLQVQMYKELANDLGIQVK